MLRQASDVAVTLYLVIGTAVFGWLAVSCAYAGVRDAFRPCYTIRSDGTPSKRVDSFHLRSWLIGLGIPSYRMTALRGFGRVLLWLVLAMLAGCVAVLIGMGISR